MNRDSTKAPSLLLLLFMQLSFVRRSYIVTVIINHRVSHVIGVHAHAHTEALEVPEVLMGKT